MNKQILQQLQSLINNGQIIQAIKLIRTVKKISLKDAKNFVEELQVHLQGEEHKQNLDPNEQRYRSKVNHQKYQQDFSHDHRHNIEKDLPTEVYLHLQRGEKVLAMKRLRELKGLSLNEANNLIKRFYIENPKYEVLDEKKKKDIFPFIFLAVIAFIYITKIFS